MGGQNHQPTNRVRLIAPSAWLSQRVGEGLVHVLRSNSELENAIMSGMAHLHVETLAPPLPLAAAEYLAEAISELETSLGIISEIKTAYRNLLEAAQAENYTGNPLASQLPSFRLDQAFHGNLIIPAMNSSAWKELEARISSDNILSTLEWEATQFDALREPTSQLIQVLAEAQSLAETGGGRAMVEAIECNELPLRQRFARVFSLWNHLHALFLYSALAMTELFYRTNSLGTLLNEEGVDREAASA